MSISHLSSRFTVWQALKAVVIMQVALALVDLLVDTQGMAILSVILSGVLTVAFLALLVWHFDVCIRARTYNRLLLHLVTIPIFFLAAYFIVVFYGLGLMG